MTINASFTKKINDPKVAAVFKKYPPKIRAKIMFLRQLILETAAATEGVGAIDETLKWGEPSYLTPKSKSGSTIRIDWKKPHEDQYAIYFKCTANLIPTFKKRYSNKFRFEGNRSIVSKIDEDIPVKELKCCIALALTYHRNKKLETADRWKIVENNT